MSESGRTIDEDDGHRTVELGDVDPARSRHAGRRAAVAATPTLLLVGTPSGDLRAIDRETLEERWTASSRDPDAAVVALTTLEDCVVAGERGTEGGLRCYELATGAPRWRIDTADDLGEPQRSSRFFRPFVVSLTSARVDDGQRLFAAARRYERDGEDRSFESAIYCLRPDGTVDWRYRTDASPIAIDGRGERVAVAYNRCPGEHQHGLVVLDADTGDPRWTWDPGTDGQRRVGDCALTHDGVVVASHGDYRGYRLHTGGAEAWHVDLATPTVVGDERLYAYPNHVHATPDGVVFVTGNTYPTNGRETESLHPNEHTAFGCSPAGDRRWTASVGGFAGELGTAGDRVAVPGAQHFRTRDVAAHALRTFDVVDGPAEIVATDGVVTAVSLDREGYAAVEEPVVYHDEGEERGTFRLLVGSL